MSEVQGTSAAAEVTIPPTINDRATYKNLKKLYRDRSLPHTQQKKLKALLKSVQEQFGKGKQEKEGTSSKHASSRKKAGEEKKRSKKIEKKSAGKSKKDVKKASRAPIPDKQRSKRRPVVEEDTDLIVQSSALQPDQVEETQQAAVSEPVELDNFDAVFPESESPHPNIETIPAENPLLGVNEDETCETLPPQEENPEQKWKAFLQSMKRPRSKTLPLEEFDSCSHTLISKMREADMEDKIATQEGRPGTAKLKMLPLVKTVLSKSYLHEFLVRNELLGVLSEWLTPTKLQTEAGRVVCLPNYDIRTMILDALLTLPLFQDPGRLRKADDSAWEGITKEDLQDTPLGRRVHELSKHASETKENRQKAEVLIERWSRMLFQVTRDYKQLAAADAHRRWAPATDIYVEEWKDPLMTLPAETIHSQSAEVELKARQERLKRRVHMPHRQTMVFHYRPSCQFSADEIRKRETKETPVEIMRNKLRRRTQEIKASNKIGQRLCKMSIEGSMSTMPAESVLT